METKSKILTWESEGAAAEGIPTFEELEKSPGFPSMERLEKGPVAIIECIQKIPCNPCEAACRRGAIKIGQPITNLPSLDQELCTGCGLCIACCPGLAIFVVDMTYSQTSVSVTFPYEYQPVPEVGEKVSAADRTGKRVCQGKVINVLDKPKQDHTPIVTIAVPKRCALVVRGICLKRPKPAKVKEASGNPTTEESWRISSHPVLGPLEPGKEINVKVDGKKIKAQAGEMIMASLLGAGIRVNRFTPKYNEPRGLFCGIGQCTDCIMTVNGNPNIRTCVTPVEEGMDIETQIGNGRWA